MRIKVLNIHLFQFDFGECGLNITRVVVEVSDNAVRYPIDFQRFQVFKPPMLQSFIHFVSSSIWKKIIYANP